MNTSQEAWAHSECGKGDKRRDTADVERKEGRKKVGSVTQKKLGERGPRRFSEICRLGLKTSFRGDNSNGTSSLQLFVVEFDTCLVLELLLLTSKTQTASNFPSLMAPDVDTSKEGISAVSATFIQPWQLW